MHVPGRKNIYRLNIIHTITLKHSLQYWVVVFQPITEAVESLGSFPIGVNFSMLSPMLHHTVLSFYNPYASSSLPDVTSSQTPVRPIPSCSHHIFSSRRSASRHRSRIFLVAMNYSTVFYLLDF